MPGPQMQGTLDTILPATAVPPLTSRIHAITAAENSSRAGMAGGIAGVLLGTAEDRQERCLEISLEMTPAHEPQTRFFGQKCAYMHACLGKSRCMHTHIFAHMRAQVSLRQVHAWIRTFLHICMLRQVLGKSMHAHTFFHICMLRQVFGKSMHK